jgi:hypothetical protein
MTAMSDDGETFLDRWSRAEEPRSEAEEPRQSGARNAEPEEVPLEDLPPIESIDASTDLSQWLRKRVPDAWRQAALKRVWATDPAISQFTGVAENSWDWNAPEGVPGFGPLSPTYNVTQLLERVIGQLPESGTHQAVKTAATTADSPTSETSSSDPAEPNLPKEATDAHFIDKSLMPGPDRAESDHAYTHTQGTRLTKRRRAGGALPS